MAISFRRVPPNDPQLCGQPACRKQLFGQHSRYAVAPVHTRFTAVEWFVWDAEHESAIYGRPEVIRQAPTLEKALDGLEL